MKDLTEGNTFKVLFRFAIPLIIAGIISQSYNLVDLIIAGRVIGSDALGATGCTTTLIQFLSSLFWGFGVAVSAVVGKLFGAQKQERIPIVIKTVTIFITVSMFVITLGCFLFSNQIMDLFKVDEEIKASANSYFKIYMIALLIQAITYQLTCSIQGLGDSKFPMIMTMVSGGGNLILNVLFVAVFKWGVNGLAYATIISCFISLVMGIFKTCKIIKEFGSNLKLEFSFRELKYVSKLAIPCIAQQCSLYLASVIVQPLINDMGKAVSGGYSIAMNINVFINAVYHSISRAVASYTSQSKGKKQYDNYRKGIYIGLLQQAILIIPLMAICFIFPNQIIKVFMENKDTACLPYAIQYIYICVPFLFFVALGNLMHSFYKAVGAVKTVLVTTTLFTISRILLSYLLPNPSYIFNIYMGLSIAWVIEAVALMGAYYSGIWKTKNHKAYDLNKKMSK